MKSILTLTFFFLLSGIILAQTEKSLPSIKLKDLTGKTIDISQFKNNGKPIIISFWATWCKPCKVELNAIAKEYEDWVEETGVQLIAVSIDDARSTARVGPYVTGQGWDYTILLDSNGDLKRAMNVNNVPHTIIVDGNGKIVYQHNSYTPGDEKILLEKVKSFSK